jgi:GT2 family glycosyltransferase
VSGYPVTWVPLGENTGFGAGCHAGAERARNDVVAFLNPDAVPAPGWLPPLVAALEGAGVGAAMATVELAGEPGHFNTSGGRLTYYGLAWVSDYGVPIPEEDAPVEVAFPSGTAMAMTKAVWERMGGFRRGLFLYHEDTDLGWRLRLRGLRSVRVPGSRVAHDYSFDRNRDKLFYLERNRLVLLASNYRGPTLAVLAPALALVEAGVLAVALRDGWLRTKLAAWRGFLALRCEWRAARRAVAENRTVGDAALLETMDTTLAGMRVPTVRLPRGLGVVDAVLAAYLRLVLPLVRRLDRRAGL